MIVVKVGGSLFDHPNLGPGLRAYLDSLCADVLLVPGGGGVADAVREWDRTHALGEDAAHWLALRSLGATKALLEELLGLTFPPRGEVKVRVLDPFAFAQEDESRPGALPHTWGVTTDSIAARAAAVFGAERLVLLKSADIPPGTSWPEAARSGRVDAHFPHIARTLACPIEAVSFRQYLDARA